jgi:DNA-directed RNA polymerase I subunit RPA1
LKDIKAHSDIFKEKHSKYLQYLKGDFQFESNKSASLTIQFPLEFKKLLLLSLVEAVVKRVVVRSVAGVDRCILIMPEKAGQEPHLFVQGQSFEPFEKYPDLFQLNKTSSNHSYAMKQKYGIEACRANIVKEIKSVFGPYGIEVDYRHLSLLGDFVTYNGDYRAFNRIGMEESTSPFLKMSYETTMKYLIQSSIAKETDWMNSPASALVLG